MAKKKLFGNHIEPSCETCALGTLSSDGESVLCRHAGAPSKHYSCKRFRYDPLKRTPHREPTLLTFNASDFSLMDPSDELMEPIRHDEPVDDPVRDAMLDTLRTYLDSTDAPSAVDILQLLSVADDAVEEAESAVTSSGTDDDVAATAAESPDVLPDEALDDPLLDENAVEPEEEPEEEPEATEAAAKPSTIDDTFSFDEDADHPHTSFLASEEDIRRDMEQFTVEVHKGASARAAFNDFAVEFHEADVEEEDAEEEIEPVLPPTEDTAVFLDDKQENAFEAALADEDPLLSDDLLFLNLDDLSGETIESLVLNDDGTLSATTEEL